MSNDLYNFVQSSPSSASPAVGTGGPMSSSLSSSRSCLAAIAENVPPDRTFQPPQHNLLFRALCTSVGMALLAWPQDAAQQLEALRGVFPSPAHALPDVFVSIQICNRAFSIICVALISAHELFRQSKHAGVQTGRLMLHMQT